MKKRWKKIRASIVTALVKTFYNALKSKSPEKVQKIGTALGSLLYLIPSRRRVADQNLRIAFPHHLPSEREEIMKKVFNHFGVMTTDFLAGANRSLDDIIAQSEFHGMEHMENALKEGKGALLLTGHYGNWELGARYLALKGHKLNVVIRDADQDGVNEIINSLRQGPGTNVIPRGNAVRPILEKLKANEIVAILCDQNSDEIFLPFFGRMAGTVLGPGIIAARTGSPAIPCSCTHLGNGRYRIELFPPLQPQQESVKGEGIMRAFNAWLETEIRNNPEQWLWFHDRWRSARKRRLF